MEDKRSKSIEEREEEYHKARERIFNQDVSFFLDLLDGGCSDFKFAL